jgi:septal ring factor EnvC (AmiA/AmiB activator)
VTGRHPCRSGRRPRINKIAAGGRSYITIGLILGAACLLIAPAAQAGNPASAKKKQLAKVKARIAQVKKSLDEAVDRHDALAAKLRQAEQALGQARTALNETETAIAGANKQLGKLKAERAAERNKLAAEKRSLGAQIRAAYIAGRSNRLKLMLNQEDPARIERMLGYYDYFNRARTARIDKFNARLRHLGRLENEIDAELVHLKSLKEQKSQAVAAMGKRRDARKAVLSKVEAKIHSGRGELGKLKRDKKRLQRLIDKLSQTLADIPDDIDNRSFASLQGELPWPVKGPHLASYGSMRRDGRLRREGVLIGGKAGEPVHAIAHGRVIYAGWLPHFGLLLIVDHGGGYLSLYGHNRSLYRQVGDWVDAGDVIAALGKSGGREKPALFFEVRHNKQPVDPARWCRAGDY